MKICMKYKDFESRATRKDAIANDNVHYFSSKFATGTAFLLHTLRFTPNGATWLFLVCGWSSAVLLATGNPLLSYLMWRMHIVVDMADGTIARATKTFSKSADGFDRSNHIVINTSWIVFSAYPFVGMYELSLFLISFYLYYFFSRNYFLGKAESIKMNLSENIIKDILSFEGYILFSVAALHFLFQDFQVILVRVYALLFLLIFFVKLRRSFRLHD